MISRPEECGFYRISEQRPENNMKPGGKLPANTASNHLGFRCVKPPASAAKTQPTTTGNHP